MTPDELNETDRDHDLAPDERALLAGFDRLAPQGSLRWGFDDALGRVDRAGASTTAELAPWRGLPPDLWDRGRSARIGRRFAGDVTDVLANVLAEDARAVADAAVGTVAGDGFVATWDALRYLSARVEVLERRHDPLGAPTAELDLPVLDLSEWAGPVAAWVEPTERRDRVVVGELCDRSVAEALIGRGRVVRGVDPSGPAIWAAFSAVDPGRGTPDLVLDEVADHLARSPSGSVAAVVLAACVDRVDLPGKVALLADASRVTTPGGRIVVLTSDQAAWDSSLPPTARDLLPGRPLHPETWMLLLDRAGTSGAEWHRPARGSVHAVVATVDP